MIKGSKDEVHEEGGITLRAGQVYCSICARITPLKDNSLKTQERTGLNIPHNNSSSGFFFRNIRYDHGLPSTKRKEEQFDIESCESKRLEAMGDKVIRVTYKR